MHDLISQISALIGPIIKQLLALFANPATRSQAVELSKKISPLTDQLLALKNQQLPTEFFASTPNAEAINIQELTNLINDLEQGIPIIIKIINDVIALSQAVPSPTPAPAPAPIPNPNPQ